MRSHEIERGRKSKREAERERERDEREDSERQMTIRFRLYGMGESRATGYALKERWSGRHTAIAGGRYIWRRVRTDARERRGTGPASRQALCYVF